MIKRIKIRKDDKKIILNADDFGLTHSINSSIIYLLENSLITSASIMVKRNSHALKEAVNTAKLFNSKASFGLHLDLDDFFFFDETGRYGNNEKDIIDNYREIIITKKEDIKKDICLQIDKLNTQGVNISHLDGHHFIHQFIEILEIVIPIIKEKKIKAMRFNPFFYLSSGNYERAIQLVNKNNIMIPDSFCDLSDLMYNRRNLAYEDSCVTEVMIHSEVKSKFSSSWRIEQHNYLMRNISLFKDFCLTNFLFY